MANNDNYGPSPRDWVREQVEEYESSGGTRGTTLRDTGLPVIIVTTVGRKTGMIRKVPLMRVEHNGEYAVIASVGGAPKNPPWVHNLVADPSAQIQDGPERFDAKVELVSGAEREEWWSRAVEAFPPYAEYKARTEREIPVFIARPTS